MWSVRSCVCTRKQSSAEEPLSASEIGGACPGFEAAGDNGATVQAQGLLLTGWKEASWGLSIAELLILPHTSEKTPFVPLLQVAPVITGHVNRINSPELLKRCPFLKGGSKGSPSSSLALFLPLNWRTEQNEENGNGHRTRPSDKEPLIFVAGRDCTTASFPHQIWKDHRTWYLKTKSKMRFQAISSSWSVQKWQWIF